MSGKTLWERGHEPGRQVVALGLAATLTVVAIDLLLTGGVGILFDLAFVALAIALALVVRPRDFYTVGVLPPLLMVSVFALLAATRPSAIAHPDDGIVQALVSALSSHALALAVGYCLCLACLAVRQRVIEQRGAALRPRTATGRLHPGG